MLDAPSLIDAQWTYLALSLFTFTLSFVYQAIQLPEVSDLELEEAAEQCHLNIFNRLRKTKVIWITLGIGVMAQFCYVGVQESVNTSIDKYILEVDPQASTVNYEIIGLSLFALSRFISAGAGFIFTPQQQLNFFFAGGHHLFNLSHELLRCYQWSHGDGHLLLRGAAVFLLSLQCPYADWGARLGWVQHSSLQQSQAERSSLVSWTLWHRVREAISMPTVSWSLSLPLALSCPSTFWSRLLRDNNAIRGVRRRGRDTTLRRKHLRGLVEQKLSAIGRREGGRSLLRAMRRLL